LITVSERMSNYSNSNIEKAAEAVMAGGTVVIGTETFYALAANPFMDQAVERLFYTKKRAFSKPLPLISACKELVMSKVTDVSELGGILMKLFWPGSLTIVLKAKEGFSRHVLNDSDYLGVRVPPECPARLLSSLTNGWITSTSANLSGTAPPKTVSEIPEEILSSVDVVVDSGPCPGGLPSTVIDPSGTILKILRAGAISEEDIVRRLRKKGSDYSVIEYA
jgi:L-threonylcarbamoyladenylate synthase